MAPALLWTEVGRHAGSVLSRVGIAPAPADRLASEILRVVEPVVDELLAPWYPIAFTALAHIDRDDVPYLATALAVDAEAIWSHDRGFDGQTLVRRVEWP